MPLRPSIAVLDVGFVKHPDLPSRRVIACRDATHARVLPFRYGDPSSFAEHGTRTMLLAAGDGRVSRLPSFAPEARVVLVKIGHGGRVPRETIVRAFRWILRKSRIFGVRVVLCPFGDDPETRGARSPVPGLVRALDEAGVIVVAAAGWDPSGDVVSPASSPHAIGVGGWDIDTDRPARGPRVGLVRGLLKPDLLAPAVPLKVPRLDGRRGRDIAGGTSFAAAIVASVALRLVMDAPELGTRGVFQRLVNLARGVPGQPPYLDPKKLAGLRVP